MLVKGGPGTKTCYWLVNRGPERIRLLQSQFNQWAPGTFKWNFRYLIYQIISVTYGWGMSCELTLRWMSFDLTDDMSTLVQLMAWCRPATSHYLSQCWPRSLSSYGVTRPLIKLFLLQFFVGTSSSKWWCIVMNVWKCDTWEYYKWWRNFDIRIWLHLEFFSVRVSVN